MKVLIVKTSSMGDLIHLLPALTDAGVAISDIQFDWVVEEGFAEIPCWHEKVDRVLPIALRRWRHSAFSPKTWRECRKFVKKLRMKRYDLVIDAQGLLKSALITLFSRGVRCGLNWHSAWEALASLCYERKCKVNPNQHAITRMRELMAKALHYPLPHTIPEYGIDRSQFYYAHAENSYVLFIHNTTWQSKLWPEQYWIELAKLFNEKSFAVLFPWGNKQEFERAKIIAGHCEQATVLPKLTLKEMAGVIAKAKAVVAVDTGLGHLTAALNVPCVSLYGPTSPEEVGTMGKNQIHLLKPFECAPCHNQVCQYEKPSAVKPACFEAVTPRQVFDRLVSLISST